MSAPTLCRYLEKLSVLKWLIHTHEQNYIVQEWGFWFHLFSTPLQFLSRLKCPVHPLPPTGRPTIPQYFILLHKEGNLSTCQVQIKTVNLNFNLLDQFNLFKGSPPFWRILILITGIVADVRFSSSTIILKHILILSIQILANI